MKKIILLTGLSLLSLFATAQMDTINLGDHPDYSGEVTKAVVTEITIKLKTNTVIETVEIYVFKGGKWDKKASGTVYLEGNDKTLVNASTGEYCLDGDTGCIGEYSFLQAVIKSVTPNVISVAESYPAKRKTEIYEKLNSK